MQRIQTLIFTMILLSAGLGCVSGAQSPYVCNPNFEADCSCFTSAGAACDPNLPESVDCACRFDDAPLPGGIAPPALDLGVACDPGASTCSHSCLGLSSGAGTCVGLCGASGATMCTGQFKCNAIYEPATDSTYEICLPNASCGALDYQGTCQGDTLVYCGNEGPLEIDCTTYTGDDGKPQQCALVSEAYGHDCVSGAFTGGCGQVTTSGHCEGDTVVFCESLESGVVRRNDCPAGQVCTVGGSGIAECQVPGAAGCGGVTYQGFCEGSTAIWCDENTSEVMRHDCAQVGMTCGWASDETGYWCVPGTTVSGTFSVSGSFAYEKPALTDNGLGATAQAPIRQALVQVRRTSDNTVVASNFTDDQGNYTIGFDAAEQVYVAVLTTVETDRYAVSIRDCPMDNCGGVGNPYGAVTLAFSPSANTDIGRTVLPADGGVAGAFNIFNIFIAGFDFAWENLGGKPPAVIGQWQKGSNTACGTSCFSTRGNTIYVLSTLEDSDEFDDPVLGHEFGHFLENAFSRTDSPGGAHSGEPTDPRLAWGEGYGTYVGAALFDTPRYIDSFASGASVTDISNTGIRANPSDPRGMTQLVSEFMVAEVLWTIGVGGRSSQPLGHHKVFDVLGAYFPSPNLADRGVAGVDLVDFLDGWFCLGNGDQNTLQLIVNDERGFPYDYNGPASCR